MKIRKDYVTNSSSSCFICDVCGEEWIGWDMSLENSQMYQCENGHMFCISEAVDTDAENLIKFIIKNGYDVSTYPVHNKISIQELENMNYKKLLDLILMRGHDNVPNCICPICTFSVCMDCDALLYLMKKHSTDKENVLKECRASFGSYEKFLKYIKEST